MQAYGILWLLCIFPLASSLAAAESEAADAEDQASDQAATRLFNSLIPSIEIEIEPEGMASLRSRPREYVRATLREDGVTYKNVAVKLKGARGSFRPVDGKPALTLNTDKFAPGQDFHGLDKFHLNNSVQDSSYLDEMIASELFRAAGVPTARATHAIVKLNDRELGLYVLKEGYEKRFLRRNFPDNDGNLYDGGFLMDVNQRLEKDSGDGPDDWSDLWRLANAASEQDLALRHRKLAEVLDIERFITFAALEMLTCHWDGYVQHRNNYRLYYNPAPGKFVFIPHGMDQMFSDLNYPIIPGESNSGRRRRRGLVSESVFEIPALQRQYIDRMGQLLGNVFTTARLNEHLDRIDQRVRSQLSASNPRLAIFLTGQTRGYRRRLAQRIHAANSQYAALVRSTGYQPNRSSRLTRARNTNATRSGSESSE